MSGELKSGNKRSRGRPLGSVGKFTELKAQFLAALEAKGGQKFLERVAAKDPVRFAEMISKMLPRTDRIEAHFDEHITLAWANDNTPDATPDAKPSQTIPGAVQGAGMWTALGQDEAGRGPVR